MDYIFLVIGFIILIKGADVLVDSASKLAKIFGISSFVIGLTVVALGTSAPEISIGIFSALKQSNSITLGDVVGSNIYNIAFIIGVTAIIRPITIEKSITRKELPILFVVMGMLFSFILVNNNISQIEGMILLVLFVAFLYYIFSSSKKNSSQNVNEDNNLNIDSNRKKENIPKLVFLFIIGLVSLIIGANIVVDSSVNIATTFGVSKTLIGLTIVAIGTSLPELVTCIIAALRNESDLVTGNIIGSNIFNILLVLGASTTIHPIKLVDNISFDMISMIFATVILFIFAVSRYKISRINGIILTAYYFLYIGYKVIEFI